MWINWLGPCGSFTSIDLKSKGKWNPRLGFSNNGWIMTFLYILLDNCLESSSGNNRFATSDNEENK